MKIAITDISAAEVYGKVQKLRGSWESVVYIGRLSLLKAARRKPREDNNSADAAIIFK